MKLYLIFIMALILSGCKKEAKNNNIRSGEKEILNGFGKAKIGMSISEFNKTFQGKKEIIEETNDIEGYAEFQYLNLKINDTIILDKARLSFRKNRLVSIGCQKTEIFFEYLKKKFGIKSKEDKVDLKIISFNTNNKDIYCGVECYRESCAIGIFEIGFTPNY
ncbi:hypothetical protein [Flavobacterium phycosphaerae]|uniref:hypothetical protein n=1 Tax=Flavobacterium phycosphaerae TaxID=2697515 RepID=UPI0013899F94|nr:hypothetical protein [Flavobacterium phycosphaerae]